MMKNLSSKDILKAVGLGLIVSALTAVVSVTLTLTGVSPFPTPPALIFARLTTGMEVPLPVGLLFHFFYVTFWSVFFVAFFRRTLSFLNALSMALLLWVVVLFGFFPLFGWGVAGLDISPALIPASFVPHILFALFVWGGAKLFFSSEGKRGDVDQTEEN